MQHFVISYQFGFVKQIFRPFDFFCFSNNGQIGEFLQHLLRLITNEHHDYRPYNLKGDFAPGAGFKPKMINSSPST